MRVIELIIWVIIGVAINKISDHLKAKENRKHCRYDPETKCWIPND